MATQFRTFAFALALGVVCLSSFEVRAEDSAAPVQAAVQQAAVSADKAPVAPVAETVDANLYTFKSPMIGTFYRTPSPEKDMFVKVGDEVNSGTVLCIIEAMKLFNEIESDVSGKIVKILVENAQPVEYDQPLFLIQKD